MRLPATISGRPFITMTRNAVLTIKRDHRIMTRRAITTPRRRPSITTRIANSAAIIGAMRSGMSAVTGTDIDAATNALMVAMTTAMTIAVTGAVAGADISAATGAVTVTVTIIADASDSIG